MTITFYRFGKETNSTKIPDEDGTEFDCQIYENCDILNPIIIISTIDPTRYNYCYIEKWNRYYFVNNWRWTEGRWFGELACDVLASWKTSIGDSTQYVVRSASNYDGNIVDTAYPTTADPSYSFVIERNIFEDAEGSYVVGVVGGRTKYYALTEADLNTLTEYLFSDEYAEAILGGPIETIYPELKARLNPLQYISCVRYIPLPIGGKSVASIPVGWANAPVPCTEILLSQTTSSTFQFTLPRHPQITRGSFLKSQPYSNYYLFIPPWGLIQLDSTACMEYDTLYASIVADPPTGEGILYIEASPDHRIAMVSTPLGVDIQLAQITAPGTGLGTLAQNVLSVGSAFMMSENPMAGAVGALNAGLGAVASAAANKVPSANTIGNGGGFAALKGNAVLIAEFYPVTDEDLQNKGRPLCKKVQINTLSGYMETQFTHLEIPCTSTELQEIISLMEGGFYFE